MIAINQVFETGISVSIRVISGPALGGIFFNQAAEGGTLESVAKISLLSEAKQPYQWHPVKKLPPLKKGGLFALCTI